MAARIFLHAGLPRTATTVLQKELFPRLQSVNYVGKLADNQAIRGHLKPFEVLNAACDRYLAGDPSGMSDLRRLTCSIVVAFKDISAGDSDQDPHTIMRVWEAIFDVMTRRLPDKPLLFSDESLVESTSGLHARLEYRDDVLLEQFRDYGWLEKDVSVSVVLREPLAFLTASYYKTMEFKHRLKRPPMTFGEYIDCQLRIFDRHPSASRIFLCMHAEATRHFRSLCPYTNVVRYEDLVGAPNALDFLLGVETGEPPVSIRDLGRANNSWRNEKVNEFILNCRGVPRGITIEEYARTFADSLRRRSLGHLLAKQS